MYNLKILHLVYLFILKLWFKESTYLISVNWKPIPTKQAIKVLYSYNRPQFLCIDKIQTEREQIYFLEHYFGNIPQVTVFEKYINGNNYIERESQVHLDMLRLVWDNSCVMPTYKRKTFDTATRFRFLFSDNF